MASESLDALSAALASLVFRPAAPRLEHAERNSRAASLSDLETGWAAYWLAALDQPVAPTREAWRRAATLQALFDAGALRPGARFEAERADERLASFLEGAGMVSAAAGELPDAVIVNDEEAPPASHVGPGGVLVRLAVWRSEGQARQAMSRLADGGWAAWPLHLERLDHVLDGYLQPDRLPRGRGPDLARERDGSPEREIAYIAVRAS